MKNKPYNWSTEDVKQYAEENEVDIILFDNPNFEGSIVGLSVDNRAIYSYTAMVKSLMEQDNLSEEDAIDFIEYNTFNVLNQFTNGPIVINDL